MADAITYHKEGDYLIADIETEPLNKELRRWGREYLKYMKETKPHIASMRMMFGELLPMAIERQTLAEQAEEELTSKLVAQYGATNSLKNEKPLEWAALMNRIRYEVEAQIMQEIICI